MKVKIVSLVLLGLCIGVLTAACADRTPPPPPELEVRLTVGHDRQPWVPELGQTLIGVLSHAGDRVEVSDPSVEGDDVMLDAVLDGELSLRFRFTHGVMELVRIDRLP